MYRKTFPELNWLKSRIDSGVAWPSCMLDVKDAKDYRDDIKGPFSLFTVVHGHQYCKASGRELTLKTGDAFVTNKDEYYTIDTLSPTSHVRNVHFGEDLTREVMSYLSLDSNALLNGTLRDDLPAADWGSFSLSQKRLNWLNQLSQPKTYHIGQSVEAQYAIGSLLLDILLNQFEKEFLKKIRGTRASTRREVFTRLKKSVVYIHEHYTEGLNLEVLAQEAGISKFHFLRSFTETFKMTPQKFLEKLRITEAQKLLKLSSRSIAEISFDVGYQDADTLSKKFRREMQVSPRQYRAMVS